MKPSKKIDEIAGIFQLSNTVGSSQLDWLNENRVKVLDANAGKYIQAMLDYLDEEYEKPCNHRIVNNVCLKCDFILE